MNPNFRKSSDDKHNFTFKKYGYENEIFIQHNLEKDIELAE